MSVYRTIGPLVPCYFTVIWFYFTKSHVFVIQSVYQIARCGNIPGNVEADTSVIFIQKKKKNRNQSMKVCTTFSFGCFISGMIKVF